MTTGVRVRVVLPGDPYTGQVGIVQRIIGDEGGLVYFVRFCEGHTGSLCHTAYY